ncbi:MAG: hypothetical protein JRF47_01655 [Deltaproteobacteria bacterium]|nr:hypothetical protein [Deltaproteobacteria bacterium]
MKTVAGYVLRVTGCGLRVTCYELRVTGYGLRVAGYVGRLSPQSSFHAPVQTKNPKFQAPNSNDPNTSILGF